MGFLIRDREQCRHKLAIVVILHDLVKVALFSTIISAMTIGLRKSQLPHGMNAGITDLGKIRLDAVDAFNDIWVAEADNIGSNPYNVTMPAVKILDDTLIVTFPGLYQAPQV